MENMNALLRLPEQIATQITQTNYPERTDQCNQTLPSLFVKLQVHFYNKREEHLDLTEKKIKIKIKIFSDKYD